MRYLLYVAILLFLMGDSCTRDRYDEKITVEELKNILGEPVICYKIYYKAGFLCKSESKKNYYCPHDIDSSCTFTSKMVLLDPPAESPK